MSRIATVRDISPELLSFITSLRHPANAADYARVESLLARTLRSVCAQTDARFCVTVVSNRPLSFDPGEAVENVVVDFPSPSDRRGGDIPLAAIRKDKGTKLAVGLLASLKQHPTHVMPFDADDLVSRRLAAFVAQAPDAPGWYANEGYLYVDGTGLGRRVDQFHQLCGTSFIVRADLYAPPDIGLDASQEDIVAEFGEHKVVNLLGAHADLLPHFKALGAPLAPLPFPGAVYVVGTGENASGRRGEDRLVLPVRRAATVEFSLPLRRHNTQRWRALGASASAAVRRKVRS